MTSNQLQNVWKFMGEKTSTTELNWKKKKIVFLLKTTRWTGMFYYKKKVFQNQKENVHNISMAGFLVGSS